MRMVAYGERLPAGSRSRPSARPPARFSRGGVVSQRPGSANGVLFITLEDETEIANLIVWPSLFEKQRRLVLSARMIGCRGKVQREGQVIPTAFISDRRAPSRGGLLR